MTTNRLAKSEAVERTPLEWCQRGNDILEKLGRRDVHWVLRQGRPAIEWKCAPSASGT